MEILFETIESLSNLYSITDFSIMDECNRHLCLNAPKKK